jgi:hypothetical protein
MINENVPDKTIAIFANTVSGSLDLEKDRLFKIIKRPDKKRDWFSPHFYRCLPLTIGNQYGFIITNEFDFSFLWNGEDSLDALTFEFNEGIEELDKKYSRIESRFGHGIITVSPPFFLKTPPGVNLMTINPPNHVVPNVTVMTGVIETDNLNYPFTFNLKVQIPGIKVSIPAGTPLAGFIPIPRYYADSFDLKLAEDVFDENKIVKDLQTFVDTGTHRDVVETKLPDNVGKLYMRGQDVYGNKFSDHQKP